jgi:hypothetical protein
MMVDMKVIQMACWMVDVKDAMLDLRMVALRADL